MGWMDEMQDGGQFGGLTNKGLKYNGAWGGPAKNGLKVIEDDRGQWAHPGKITKINSNNITMKGVYEPLIGVSEQTGEKKVMLPGKNYNFANTKQVTEYPLNNWLDKI